MMLSHAGGEITAEEFASLKMIENPGRVKKNDATLMFESPLKNLILFFQKTKIR